MTDMLKNPVHPLILYRSFFRISFWQLEGSGYLSWFFGISLTTESEYQFRRYRTVSKTIVLWPRKDPTASCDSVRYLNHNISSFCLQTPLIIITCAVIRMIMEIIPSNRIVFLFFISYSLLFKCIHFLLKGQINQPNINPMLTWH